MVAGSSACDFRDRARRRLPRFLFDYLEGGSFDEITATRNLADLRAVTFRQRALRSSLHPQHSVSLFGNRYSLPMILGPVGFAGANARRGEVQAARAAAAVGVPFCVSMVSVCSYAEVARAVSDPPWFQLYMLQDHSRCLEVLQRVHGEGCRVLIFTVDAPISAPRHRDIRNGLAGAGGPLSAVRRFAVAASHIRWAWDVGVRGQPLTPGNLETLMGRTIGSSELFTCARELLAGTVTWDDLEFVRANWTGALIVKGILDAEDARRAVRCGSDGIVVSNHGGRQLDSVPSSVSVIPSVADAIGTDAVILADSGVRSGLDALKMVASGARATLLGRAWAYALAADGRRGVERMLFGMRTEIRAALTLLGVGSIDELDRTYLMPD